MAIKVGRVPYLNCEPFYFAMERRGIELCDMAPNAVASAAEKGEIDAGPAPLVDFFRLAGHFRPLSGFCLAAASKAGSVFLHSKRPIQELTGARIGIADETPTAISLLRVLLTLKHQVQPEAYVALEDPYDACLLTGTQGLRRRRGVRGYPHKYDLGEEWHQWTGLPFVFARWIVRKDMDPKAAALVEDALYVALQDWADGLYRLYEPRDKVLMLPMEMLVYTQGFRYFIGAPEEKAIELFRQYLDQLKLDIQLLS
jgi:chorismate dehydratase